MGYTTRFKGQFDLDKPLWEGHEAYLRAFSRTRRMARDAKHVRDLPDLVRVRVGLPVGVQGGYFVGGSGDYGTGSDGSILSCNHPPEGQPGLWCQWVPSEDGTHIMWDEVEKFYKYTDWLQYVCDHFLSPWGYAISGSVEYQGEDPEDRGVVRVALSPRSLRDFLVEKVPRNSLRRVRST